MIFNSPNPDVEIPVTPFTPFLLAYATSHPDKPALIDGPSGRVLTYGQLVNAIRYAAAGLHARGFKKGQVFAICSPNLPEYAVAFHAVATLGGIVTTINPLYTAEEIATQLNDCQARYLLTIPPFIEKARLAQAKSALEEIFVFGEGEGATPFSVLLQSDGVLPEVTIDPKEDLIVLPYSSGTTGLPKGVMLTHYNLVSNIAQMRPSIDFGPDDTMIGILPFYHIYGMIVVMSFMLYVGGTVVTMPQFDLETFLKIMQDYRITRACLVPPIIVALAKHPSVDHYDLSHLKQIFSGAAPLSAELQAAVSKRIGCLAVQGYGLTETSPVTHATPNDRDQVKVGSVGPSLANTQVCIVDIGSRQLLGAGQEGEIWIRGPQVMKGYLNNPSATAHMIDSEGWLHTGDIGYVDQDGYLYVVDRLKELIKYKGLQVAPAELEGVLLQHDAIADVAVIGTPDEMAGEVPKAYIVLKPNRALSAEEIMSFVAEQVAPHKKIRRVEFVAQIPKSASGKILRRVLVQKDRETSHS
ncbi:MAG: 4-coumarate--CoA ligase family protein [Anaerolineae bacterium]|jgi:acyl-CoA synthetase (AMP-forming)/AMP-acid ligase II|nr:4-coumarate--CoA ligase family protein [Anaerolineae bacterium]